MAPTEQQCSHKRYCDFTEHPSSNHQLLELVRECQEDDGRGVDNMLAFSLGAFSLSTEYILPAR